MGCAASNDASTKTERSDMVETRKEKHSRRRLVWMAECDKAYLGGSLYYLPFQIHHCVLAYIISSANRCDLGP